jgi:predicted dehydrogenase
MIKVSILGIGKMGKNHLRILNMLKNVQIEKIFDLNEEALIQLSKQYNVDYTTDVDDAVSGVDAVLIVTPTSTHFDYFKACVGKVKNIFIEKPLAANYQDGVKIAELAKEHGTFIQCGFIERFNPVVSELKNILKNDKVINADFTRTNRLSSRITDVDVVLDLMIHDIDLAIFLNGDVEEVFAFGTKENGLVSFASALLRHKSGSISRILASRMTEKKMRSITVTTETSFIDAELVRKEIVLHKQSKISQVEGQPYMISSLEQQVEVRQQEALLTELQVFIDACNSNHHPDIPTVEDGLESLRISEIILGQINND